MSSHDEQTPNGDFAGLKDDSVPDVQSAYEAAHAEPSKSPTPPSPRAKRGLFAETEPSPIDVPARRLKWSTRRDFLIYGIGAAAVATTFWKALPLEAQKFHVGDSNEVGADEPALKNPIPSPDPASRKEKLLDKSLVFDDEVAEALYSTTRLVPTYDKSQITKNLRNNYDGLTPDPGYLDDWVLTITGTGLASGQDVELDIDELKAKFGHHEQVTRLVCVEGWSAIAWWGGIRFADLLKAYPPKSGCRWASLQSDVNLDGSGNSDPYYVSIDLPTAVHPQTLLATHQNAQPLTVEHGAPLRLIAPMKLGLKNIKAITSITYSKNRPDDYWADRGYSQYDGV